LTKLFFLNLFDSLGATSKKAGSLKGYNEIFVFVFCLCFVLFCFVFLFFFFIYLFIITNQIWNDFKDLNSKILKNNENGEK
jgi:ABC-type Fe3+ transport system permease subunit